MLGKLFLFLFQGRGRGGGGTELGNGTRAQKKPRPHSGARPIIRTVMSYLEAASATRNSATTRF